MESIKRICRYFYYRFIRLQASPEVMAQGVALGLFISTTPTFGFQTVIALFLAALFRVSKLCAVLAVQFTNALTAPFIYAGTYYLGAFFLGRPAQQNPFDDFSFKALIELGPSVFSSLWVGGVLLGIVLGIMGYFMVIGIDTKAHRQIIRAKNQVERLKRKKAPVLEKID